MTLTLDARAAGDIAQALTIASLPETTWEQDDDGCDCLFPRLGFWTNPYTAATLEVRMCCIWKQLYELFPGAVRETRAFYDYNAGEWCTDPQEWDGEHDMPKHLWYRQLARQQGRDLRDIRAEYASRLDEKPKGIPRPPEPEMPPEPTMFSLLMDMVIDMAGRLDALEAKS